MSAQNKSAMWKLFPAIDNPTKASMAMCATVFDELDAALDLLNSARGDFNPLQRQLVSRFIAVCKVFGRDMLAADGNPDALRAVFGLSAGTPGDQADKPAGGRTLLDDVCTGACGDLERIGATVQGELLEGVADVMASIRASQEPGASEGDALDAMASSVRELAHQVTALFEAQPYALRRHQLVYQADIEAAEDDPMPQRGVTVDEFLASIKPPIRRPALRDRLDPYIPQLMKLRAHGYTYAQCAQFMRENGISTYRSLCARSSVDDRRMGSVMTREKMKQNTRAALLTAAAIALPALASAADQPAGQAETLADFVQQSWKLQNFQIGRDSVMSTVPLRVSTYSSPPFIHRGQLENLRGKSQELAGLCERQGGQWRYLGPPMADKPAPGQPPPANPATADAAGRAPVTEAGVRDVVKVGEQGVAADVWKAMVQAALKQPDPLVADALEYALRQKWLGRFECQREASAWSAGISYAKWANRGDRGLVYKDVTLKVELAEGK